MEKGQEPLEKPEEELQVPSSCTPPHTHDAQRAHFLSEVNTRRPADSLLSPEPFYRTFRKCKGDCVIK